MSTIEGIARNRISHSGIEELKKLLQKTKFLSILDASSIGIGDEGLAAICSVLADEAVDCPLQSLRLQMSEIASIEVLEKLKAAIPRS